MAPPLEIPSENSSRSNFEIINYRNLAASRFFTSEMTGRARLHVEPSNMPPFCAHPLYTVDYTPHTQGEPVSEPGIPTESWQAARTV